MPPPAPSQTRPAGELEGADRDVELEARHRAAVADRAGVDLARRRLQLVDDLERAHLRGAGDRAGREGRPDQVAVGGAGAERAADRGDQVPDPRVRLGAEQAGHGDAAGDADPAEVVAHQVDDHHVLGAILRRALQGGSLRFGLVAVGLVAGAVPLMGLDSTRLPARRRNSSGKGSPPRHPARSGTRRTGAPGRPPPGRTRRAGRRGSRPPRAGRCWPGRCPPARCTRPSGGPPPGAPQGTGPAGSRRSGSRRGQETVPRPAVTDPRTVAPWPRHQCTAPRRTTPPSPGPCAAHGRTSRTTTRAAAAAGRRQRLARGAVPQVADPPAAERRVRAGTRIRQRRADSAPSRTSSSGPLALLCTSRGRDPTMSQPPAHAPNSATGCGSARTRRSTCTGVRSQLSGLRTRRMSGMRRR